MTIMATALPIHRRPFDDLLAEAVSFHGHLCPGQVLGVRMTMAGCREVDVPEPRNAGKSLVVIVEIDRCPADAVQALTGVSVGKRTLRHADFGKTAATFVNRVTGRAVRVVARESARDLAARLVPDESDPRHAQIVAYRRLAEPDLLAFQRVIVDGAWLDRSRVRVACHACGEAVSYEREVSRAGVRLCRACAGERYYRYDGDHTAGPGRDVMLFPTQ